MDTDCTDIELKQLALLFGQMMNFYPENRPKMVKIADHPSVINFHHAPTPSLIKEIRAIL
jgi:hypothetical protein